MGACCTSPAPVAPNADGTDPPNRNGVPPFTTTASGGKGSKGSKPTPASTQDNQGRHWAENSANKKRAAKAPWQMKTDASAPKPSTDACEPCNDQGFDFAQTFPMFVMKMKTFMELKTMRSHEDMLAEGKVFEWTPSMGRVWFMSHQWTSFSHPDPAAEQLTVAQKLVKTIMDGKARSIFATEEEWQGYITREANRFLNFPELTAEQLAEDATKGYVWLDYASVPQASEAEEQRANAIDSIPYYVDHALVFLALVPRVEHKDLPGVFCDYKSWQSRGWCRLETQVHELRLSTNLEGEIMPGVGKIDVPRRPLIVHSADYATTYDLFDNFYMNWQRKNSVFTGEFACCRLGHKRTAGTLHAGSKAADKGGTIPCDKGRIKPLVRALWERKIAHMKTQHPMLQWMLLWRWVTHTELLMSENAEDDGSADDPALSTLEDIITKYNIGDDVWFGVVPRPPFKPGTHRSAEPLTPCSPLALPVPGRPSHVKGSVFLGAPLLHTVGAQGVVARLQGGPTLGNRAQRPDARVVRQMDGARKPKPTNLTLTVAVALTLVLSLTLSRTSPERSSRCP
jgi:hypothetical protein